MSRGERRALAIYETSFFARLPDRGVTVYVFGSKSTFRPFCLRRQRIDCDDDLAYYSRYGREIAVNVGPGPTTITHEIIHPLVQTDFPRAPLWFDEGLGALFEQPVFSPPGEIHGAKNWRYERLAQALASPAERRKVRLEALFSMNPEPFIALPQSLVYAMARYACQWLDERGQLWPFYRAWRDGVSSDVRGDKAFASVVGKTPAEANDEWVGWVEGLR
jgi:hypothetical protein